MANLMVTIIALALIAIAVVAVTYYGSTSWTKGSNQAKATTLINQKEQIKTAAALYKSTTGNGDALTELSVLTDGNLMTDIPEFENAVWDIAGEKVFAVIPDNLDAAEICNKAYQEEHGSEDEYFIPFCNQDGGLADDDICCIMN